MSGSRAPLAQEPPAAPGFNAVVGSRIGPENRARPPENCRPLRPNHAWDPGRPDPVRIKTAPMRRVDPARPVQAAPRAGTRRKAWHRPDCRHLSEAAPNLPVGLCQVDPHSPRLDNPQFAVRRSCRQRSQQLARAIQSKRPRWLARGPRSITMILALASGGKRST